MAKLIPLSLTARLFLVSTLVVLLFLPLAGLVLEQAYSNSLDSRLREQLKIQAYGLMGLADEIEPGKLWLPESLPDERFNQLGSGRYALVINGQGKQLWRSQSSLNVQLQSPTTNLTAEGDAEEAVHPVGEFIFEKILLADQEMIETTRVSIIWEGPENTEHIYTFVVAESLSPYIAEKLAFRETLLLWLGGLAVFLLAVNVFALLWALRPLKRLAEEIQQIETGASQFLQTEYPSELNLVAKNLNALIRHEQKQRQRYRNTLQDLAHSLKTPLSVIQVSLSNIEDNDVKNTLLEHVSRMNDIVSYQLQRSVSSGSSPIKQKVNIHQCLEKIFGALAKVYHGHSITFTNQVKRSSTFYGDENDLLEILGNVCDNACKHGRSKVIVEVKPLSAGVKNLSEMTSDAMILCITDDGDGIPEPLQKIVFQRGKRLDENNEGQGIGLSVVNDIVSSYKGSITIVNTQQGLNSLHIILPGCC